MSSINRGDTDENQLLLDQQGPEIKMSHTALAS